MSSSQDYLDLLSSPFELLPNFSKVIALLTSGFVDGINGQMAFPSSYALDTAQGQQLDVIGQWVGVTRYLRVPVTGVYLTWDGSAALGWDSGLWKDIVDPMIKLPDDVYRNLIKAKILTNAWDGTIAHAITIWNILIGSTQTLIMQDNQDMSLTLALVGSPVSPMIQALLTDGYLALKPAGVRINYALPVDTSPLFAWDTSTSLLDGWGTGSWASGV